MSSIVVKPSDMSKSLIAQERVFTRGRGCWNCKAFENDHLSKDMWKSRRGPLVAGIASTMPLDRLGDMEGPAIMAGDPRMAQIQMMDAGVSSGAVGICMKGGRPDSMGGPGGDFVDCRFLCDRWDGKDGHSLATAGRPLDKLNEELKEIADERAKKNKG